MAVGFRVSITLLGSSFLFSELPSVEAPRSWSDAFWSGLPRPADAGCFAHRWRSSLVCSPSGDDGTWWWGGWWLVRNGLGIGSSIPALAVVGLMAVLETLSASVTCFVSMISVIELTALPLSVCRCGSLGCTQCVRIRCSRNDRVCMLYVPYDVTFSGRRRSGTRSVSVSGRGRCRGPQACSRWSWNQRFSRGVQLHAAGTSGAWRSHGPGAGAGALRLLRDGDGGRRAPGLRLTGAHRPRTGFPAGRLGAGPWTICVQARPAASRVDVSAGGSRSCSAAIFSIWSATSAGSVTVKLTLPSGGAWASGLSDVLCWFGIAVFSLGSSASRSGASVHPHESWPFGRNSCVF